MPRKRKARGVPEPDSNYARWLAEVEAELLKQLASVTSGNVSKMSELATVERTWLVRRLKQLGVNAHAFRGGAPVEVENAAAGAE